jgi:heme exporter protein B
VLSAILVLPLTIPLLIFGVSATSAVDLDSGPATFTTPFLILSALALFSVVVGSVASAQALRLAAE